jgi:hypothetical protein
VHAEKGGRRRTVGEVDCFDESQTRLPGVVVGRPAHRLEREADRRFLLESSELLWRRKCRVSNHRSRKDIDKMC